MDLQPVCSQLRLRIIVLCTLRKECSASTFYIFRIPSSGSSSCSRYNFTHRFAVPGNSRKGKITPTPRNYDCAVDDNCNANRMHLDCNWMSNCHQRDSNPHLLCNIRTDGDLSGGKDCGWSTVSPLWNFRDVTKFVENSPFISIFDRPIRIRSPRNPTEIKFKVMKRVPAYGATVLQQRLL
jgi:hypothetical protein